MHLHALRCLYKPKHAFLFFLTFVTIYGNIHTFLAPSRFLFWLFCTAKVIFCLISFWTLCGNRIKWINYKIQYPEDWSHRDVEILKYSMRSLSVLSFYVDWSLETGPKVNVCNITSRTCQISPLQESKCLQRKLCSEAIHLYLLIVTNRFSRSKSFNETISLALIDFNVFMSILQVKCNYFNVFHLASTWITARLCRR